MTEQQFWVWVKSIGWSKMVVREKANDGQIDIDGVSKTAIADLVAIYGQQQAQEVAGQIKAHYDRLVGAVYRVQNEYTEWKGEEHWEDVAQQSSDCRMDLNAHIVGCGEKEYYRCLRSPVHMKHLCKWKKGQLQYAEGFQYIIYALGDFSEG
jgi:hypothetical protein